MDRGVSNAASTGAKKKRLRNPWKVYREYRTKKRLEKERVLMEREERMCEDLERYLMEMEEQRSWLAYHLNHLNFQRLKKLKVLKRIEAVESAKDKQQLDESLKEDGLSFYQGNVQSYKRWQNSPAKYRDFIGHKDAVSSCKLSACGKYILSCSGDTTARMWDLASAECLKVFTGHSKVVNDADFHPVVFKMYSIVTCWASCSGDGTLRFWNTSATTSVTTVFAHAGTVYRCMFAPDGCSVITCSEDKTIRTWNFPEGYNIFVYSAHTSPVISVRYSPSGRYFVSGSDYGERKILLWDAKRPHMHDPSRFPHILYWSTTGLIKKILIRRESPRPGFWLAQHQLGWITSDQNLDIWEGEGSDDEGEGYETLDDTDEGEEDAEEADEAARKKKERDDRYRSGDVTEVEGVLLDVVAAASSGGSGSKSRDSATEYPPGGSLVVRVQSLEYFLEQAFVSAFVKERRFETYTEDAGQRAGAFSLEAPIPWLPMKASIEPGTGKRVFCREAPQFMELSRDGLSVQFAAPAPSHPRYRVTDDADDDASTATVAAKDTMELVWNCPEAAAGTVVIVFNFKLKGHGGGWKQLRYSLKEGPPRVDSHSTAGAAQGKTQKTFRFDQLQRHVTFWNYVRDKEWTAAASFIDKFAVAYMHEEVVKRRFRVMNMLVNMFEESEWLIVHSPFIFKPGVTKSVVLCESEFDEGDDEEEEVAEGAEGAEGTEGVEGSAAEAGGEDASRTTRSESDGDGRLLPVQEGDEGEEDPSRRLTFAPEPDAEADADADADADPVSTRPDSAGDESSGVDRPLSRESGGDPDDQSPDPDAADPGSPDQNPAETEADAEEGEGFHVHNLGHYRPRSEPLHLPQLLSTLASRDAQAQMEAELARLVSAQVEEVMRLLHDVEVLQELPARSERGAALALFTSRAQEQASALGFTAAGSQIVEKLHMDGLAAVDPVLVELGGLATEDFDAVVAAFDALISEFKHHTALSDFYHSDAAKQLKHALQKPLEEPQSNESFPAVKSGRYGPEIDDFSMPLPVLYPLRAGDAKFALQPVLQIFQRTLLKLQVEALPRTLEEVYEPTLRDRWRRFYHRMNQTETKVFRAKLRELLYQSAKVQFVQEHCYVASRRASFHSLPGLANHYPNAHCEDPAVVPAENQYAMPEKAAQGGFLDKLFGRPVVRSVVVPPVGRRPDPQRRLQIQNAFYRTGKSAKFGGSLQAVEYQVNVLDNLISQDSMALGDSVMASSVASSPTHRAAQSSKKPARKKKVSRSASIKSTRSLEAAVERAYPTAFFRERRGFFHELPSLEDFAAAAAAAARHPHARAQVAGDSDKSADAQADAESSVWSGPAGLLKRFRVHGFELAHHGAVNDVVFSPSELRVASAGGDSFIKVWDPRDGSYVRRLAGHQGEVFSVRYTSSEQFLISAGADAILIWNLLTNTVQRRLRGHVDVITSLAMTPDGSLLVSASQDHTLKTWCTTPRRPVAPDAPKIISFTERTVYISWVAPPSFNSDITAFHFQQRVGSRGLWARPGSALGHSTHTGQHDEDLPAHDELGQCIAPHLRHKVVEHIIPATSYQFRVCAENAMGRSDWSAPSVLVKTAYGLPEQVEQPWISRITRTALHLLWFTPNPATFGSAATAFEVQVCGDGQDYEHHATARHELLAVRNYGEHVLQVFEHMRERRDALQAKLLKSQQFTMRNRQSAEQKADYEVSDTMASETVFRILERAEDASFLLVGCEVPGLVPGMLYTMRVRGTNVVGAGAWSVATLSTATHATIPSVPHAPRLAAATLRSLTFQWDPPEDDGGTAITGYRIFLQLLDKHVDLPRSSVTFTWTGLFPGRSYRVQVLAKNVVGESAYSAVNAEIDSYTQTAPPDASTNPLAVAGTWNALTFEVDIPYHNGARVTGMDAEVRSVQPFLIGDWQRLPHKSVADDSRDVDFVTRVDLDAQQRDMEVRVRAVELAARSTQRQQGAAKAKKKPGAKSLEQEIEALILSLRPAGHRVRFTVPDLEQDTMFECRVRFSNLAGAGEFSAPSHRAKTNKAALPGQCHSPEVLQIGATFLMLELRVPQDEGGATVTCFQVESMNLDVNATTAYRCLRHESNATEHFRMDNLTPGHSFLLRCRAESAVGCGPFSAWTKEVAVPVSAPVDAGSAPATAASASRAARTPATPQQPATPLGVRPPLSQQNSVVSQLSSPSHSVASRAPRNNVP